LIYDISLLIMTLMRYMLNRDPISGIFMSRKR